MTLRGANDPVPLTTIALRAKYGRQGYVRFAFQEYNKTRHEMYITRRQVAGHTRVELDVREPMCRRNRAGLGTRSTSCDLRNQELPEHPGVVAIACQMVKGRLGPYFTLTTTVSNCSPSLRHATLYGFSQDETLCILTADLLLRYSHDSQ